MAQSIYDLVYSYIDIVLPKEKLTGEEKKTIHREIKRVLMNGWCEDEIIKRFKEHKRKRPSNDTLEVKSLFTGKKKIKQNLLKPNVFYYHNDLRLTSAPPKREIDYDSGEIKIINEPYFLEMKSTYTVEDLVKYYLRQCKMNVTKEQSKRFVGSFNWMLKLYEVDVILFMIDASINHCISEDMPVPYSPLDMQKFLKNAEDAMNRKKTELVISGGNKIVRKKRVRTS